jgi:hypothetical protein
MVTKYVAMDIMNVIRDVMRMCRRSRVVPSLSHLTTSSTRQVDINDRKKS